MNQTTIQNDFLTAWCAVFPNSTSVCPIGRFTMTHYYFKGFLFKDKTEWPNTYQENDPLYYRFTYNVETNTLKEDACCFYTKPAAGSFLAMQPNKLRLKTIKNVDIKQLIKRFEEIKAFIQPLASNSFSPELVASKLI